MGCVFSSPFQRADTRIESEPFVVKNDIGDGRGSQREAAGFHRVYREHTDLSRVFCRPRQLLPPSLMILLAIYRERADPSRVPCVFSE
jgi:hypothetical protein